ncbi:hypothetical protein PoB_006937800, partial [Plakobranchus ocellatus]
MAKSVLAMKAAGTLASPFDCENGITLPDGTCDCFSCWKGDNCNEYASKPPVFALSYDHETLTDDHLEGAPVYKAEATDMDEEFCKDPEGCACTVVIYSIEDQGEDPIFSIDSTTGELTLSSENYELLPS